MNHIELRAAQLGDEHSLAYIQTESWKAAFNNILSPEELKKSTDICKAEIMYRKVLENNNVNMSIEFVDQKPHCIAGWSKNRNNLEPNVAELICIHSLCDNWHKGYGTIMMNHILEEIKQTGYAEVILWVFDNNKRAIRFYEKYGFVRTNHEQLSHGASEVMYVKRLYS